jgi:hypothetical protein
LQFVSVVTESMKKILPLYILEGTWWSNRETPQILPYFQALENSGNRIELSHRTFRNIDDLIYWMRKIPRNEGAFLYIACHGEGLSLVPTSRNEKVGNEEVVKALEMIKPGAVSFLHFGCCEMVDPFRRRDCLNSYLTASNARWVSGYVAEVDWLPSTLLDLALIAELAVPYHRDSRIIDPRLSVRTSYFIRNYEQLVRSLRFSAAYRNKKGETTLYPARLH